MVLSNFYMAWGMGGSDLMYQLISGRKSKAKFCVGAESGGGCVEAYVKNFSQSLVSLSNVMVVW